MLIFFLGSSDEIISVERERDEEEYVPKRRASYPAVYKGSFLYNFCCRFSHRSKMSTKFYMLIAVIYFKQYRPAVLL